MIEEAELVEVEGSQKGDMVEEIGVMLMMKLRDKQNHLRKRLKKE